MTLGLFTLGRDLQGAIGMNASERSDRIQY
jgi:hypothetical protein